MVKNCTKNNINIFNKFKEKYVYIYIKIVIKNKL